jgi:hypothetical protein
MPRGRKSAAKKHPKRAAKKRAIKRIDWSKRKAPKPGTKLRERYEKSATYKKRVARAQKGLVTRKKHEAREQRRLAAQERKDAMKERLAPLLRSLVSSWQRRENWSDTREAHGNWYEGKELVRAENQSKQREREFFAMLEELQDDYDLDELGWNIVY